MELLAPAGDMSALKAAVYNGADAVYLGVKNFNARIGADNFDDLTKAIRFCHFFNVKVYLTLNTSIKNKEIDEARALIKDAASAGIDAFIISDLALLPIIKAECPFVEVHASTQMGIHNRYGAQLLEKMGFDRLILSREVTLDDIKDIKKYCKIPVEVFAHGAICVGFSGGCLFSGMLTGCSGNRGRCKQLCRTEFSASTKKGALGSGYLLSTKDLCAVEMLEELKNAGVDSIKIEGRLKRSEYVGGVVAVYRRALDGNFDKSDINELKKLFNRGDYTTGYGESSHIIYKEVPNHIGIYAGRVRKVGNGESFISLNREAHPEDGYKILRKGLEIGGFSGKYLIQLNKHEYIYQGKPLEVGDELRLTSDYLRNICIIERERRLKVDISVEAVCGKELIARFSCGESVITVSGDIVDEAKARPISYADVERSFSRLGDTVFVPGDISLTAENAFVSIGRLNELRRRGIAALEDALICEYERRKHSAVHPFDLSVFADVRKEALMGNFVEVSQLSDVSSELPGETHIVFTPADISLGKNHDIQLKNGRLPSGQRVWLKLPIFADFASIETILQYAIPFYGIICNNYYAISVALELKKPFVLDVNMNMMNDRNPLLAYASGYLSSLELNKNEVLGGSILYAYGYVPLIHLRHCPYKTFGIDCGHCNGDIELSDEKGNYRITTRRIGGQKCFHTMYNAVLTDIGSKLAGNKQLYIDISSMDDKNTAKRIVFDYGNHERMPLGNVTKNHLNRGVL